VAASVAAALMLGPGEARAVCSGLDGRPCVPHVCSRFEGPRRVQDIFFPPGQDDRVTVQGRDRSPAKPTKPVNAIKDVFAAFRECWRGPPPNLSRPGTEITIRFSFKRDGSMIGSPRVTFQTELSQEQRHAYFTAVAEALQRCVPLPFTESFGNAVAGHPFAIRFVDDRNTKKAECHL
jgi:hypothetical protein